MKVHQVKTRLVNSYVVEYDGKLMVCDVAVRCERYVLGYIEQTMQRSIADVELVICTHDDPDHMGGVMALAWLCDAEVALPFAAGSTLHKFKNNSFGAFTRFTTSLREAFRPRAWKMYLSSERNEQAREEPRYNGEGVCQKNPMKIDEDHRLHGEQALPHFEDWQVVHTPGHSWDSVCYYHAESGSLLSGDTLLGSGTLGRLVTPSIYSNEKHTESTLCTLQQLPMTAVYPGHGSIMRGSDLIEQVQANR